MYRYEIEEGFITNTYQHKKKINRKQLVELLRDTWKDMGEKSERNMPVHECLLKAGFVLLTHDIEVSLAFEDAYELVDGDEGYGKSPDELFSFELNEMMETLKHD